MWLGKGQEGPPLHIHRGLQEELEVLSGKLEIYRNGKWEMITSGTKWTVPSNEEHSFRTVPDSDAKVRFRAIPALGFEGYFRDTEKLIKSGKLTSFKSLNGLIYSSMVTKKYSDTFYPSQMSMRIIISIGNFIGRLSGRKV